MIKAELEDIALEEIARLRNLAIKSIGGPRQLIESIPRDGHNISYATVSGRGLALDLNMWETTSRKNPPPQNSDALHRKKYLKIEHERNGEISITLEDAFQKETNPFHATITDLSLEPFDLQGILVGYTHPSLGRSRIVSLILPLFSDAGSGKIIKFSYETGQDEQIQRRKLIETAPGLEYKTSLTNPNAPLPNNRVLAQILGMQYVSAVHLLELNPWILRLGDVEKYAYSRAQAKGGTSAETRQEILEATLARLKEYELNGYRVPRKSDTQAAQPPSPPKSVNHGDGMNLVLSIPEIPDKIQPPSLENMVESYPKDGATVNPNLTMGGNIFYYSGFRDSEFFHAIEAGIVRKGSFVYHSSGKMGTVMGFINRGINKDRKLDSIVISFQQGVEALRIGENGEDTSTIKKIPEGAQLPDGTVYHITNPAEILKYVLGAKYSITEAGTVFGYARLISRTQKNLIGSDGHYNGEDLIRYAFRKDDADFFRQLGYKGETREVLRRAHSDFEAITTYTFSGENEQAVQAYFKKIFPEDALALLLASELSRGPFNDNYVRKTLPGKLDLNVGIMFEAIDRLVAKNAVRVTNGYYELNLGGVLTVH